MNDNRRAEGHAYQFDAYCKKVLKNEARNGYKEEARRWDNLKPLSFLSEQELLQLYEMDDYPSEFHRFHVMGHAVDVHNDRLISALHALSEQNRLITLLAYALKVSDATIGTLLNLGRRAVQYRRIQAIEEIKYHMEEQRRDDE